MTVTQLDVHGAYVNVLLFSRLSKTYPCRLQNTSKETCQAICDVLSLLEPVDRDAIK